MRFELELCRLSCKIRAASVYGVVYLRISSLSMAQQERLSTRRSLSDAARLHITTVSLTQPQGAKALCGYRGSHH